MNIKKHPVRYSVLLLILLTVFVGLGKAWLSEPPAPYVLTAPVTQGELKRVVLASGVIQALRQVDIGAQASGQLKHLSVEAGDKVKKGQLLAEIDPELIQNELKVSQASLDGDLAQQKAKTVQLKQAELEWQRQATMWLEQSTSEKEMLAAQTQYHTLQAELDTVGAKIRQSEFQVDKNRTTLGYTRILAPMDGEVLELVTQQGQTVIATQQAPVILKLADLSQVTIKAFVSEADIIHIRAGLPVYFTVLGAHDKRFNSTLRTILPTPEKINGAIFYKALFDVPNPEGLFRVEMTAEVAIVLAQVEKALSIPLAALGTPEQDDRYTVQVQTADGKLNPRVIRTGLKTSTRIQVLEGLVSGELVVISNPLTNQTTSPETVVVL
ncbi:macrolide-specific efflux system membrane fusion protein [Herbaspirillum sp. Sphag1AN]|uniref:macrolide transporter subunit MacA n=1 Tax=unclassified Herbaspirillum TaxID=2624150 RepID=UPI0016223894|nr:MULTISPECIES: macrolide transporter subunit MacA [unclassified Herbaspirillum]MBB3212250.1 macrolide-specific efflux system membrane fusion protein [Herbaspirillum sp. Sphag1AN]MBB3245652.1 macrolide-specific efflux system membrane fusion protein [Herbaspirillum sp. Sphag64]